MNIKANELYHLSDIGHRCTDCIYYRGTTAALSRYLCKLSNVLMPNDYACGLYNKDISDEPICRNCKNFIGGSDWGLSCAADYYTLTHALDDKCDKFEKREKGE